MTDRKDAASKLWAVVRREPLVLFIILGALLYGVWTVLAPREKMSVQIEASALRSLEKAEEELLGRPLTDEERERAREDFIDDEVLLREALGRGLQWSDPRVRKRLLQVMRGSLAERVPDPSVAQLQAHFRDNVERFTTSESATFQHVFFPWGGEAAGEEAGKVLEALRSGKDPDQFGVSSPLIPRRMKKATRGSLIRTYGLGSDFSDGVERLPAGQWHGPLESLRGVHLVRVEERHPPQTAAFEEIEDYLRQDWIFVRTREIQEERIAELREKYRVEMVEE
jgi:hypothetical protein